MRLVPTTSVTYLIVSGRSLLPDFLAHSLGEVPQALIVLLVARLPRRVRSSSPTLRVIIKVKRSDSFLPGPPSHGATAGGGRGRRVRGGGVGGCGQLGWKAT